MASLSHLPFSLREVQRSLRATLNSAASAALNDSLPDAAPTSSLSLKLYAPAHVIFNHVFRSEFADFPKDLDRLGSREGLGKYYEGELEDAALRFVAASLRLQVLERMASSSTLTRVQRHVKQLKEPDIAQLPVLEKNLKDVLLKAASIRPRESQFATEYEADQCIARLTELVRQIVPAPLQVVQGSRKQA
jgi:hypothetical protein